MADISKKINYTVLKNAEVDDDNFIDVQNDDIIELTEKTVEKPAEKPTEKPAEKPIEKPAEKPIEKPIEKKSEKEIEKPAEKPAENPAEQQIEKPIEEDKKNKENEKAEMKHAKTTDDINRNTLVNTEAFAKRYLEITCKSGLELHEIACNIRKERLDKLRTQLISDIRPLAKYLIDICHIMALHEQTSLIVKTNASYTFVYTCDDKIFEAIRLFRESTNDFPQASVVKRVFKHIQDETYEDHSIIPYVILNNLIKAVPGFKLAWTNNKNDTYDTLTISW